MNEIQKLLIMLIADKNEYSIEVYNARITSFISEENFALNLKKAGVYKIRFGLESFSPDVRKDMGKAVSTETIENVLKYFSKSGIRTDIFMIYAYPSEREEDFDLTMKYLFDFKSNINHVFFNFFILNARYISKKSNTVTILDSVKGFANWESEHVTVEVMWNRFKRLKVFLDDNYSSRYNLSDPSGKYFVG